MRGAYDTVRADQILDVFGQINSAIISYLKAKVLASLGLAFFAGIILTACGVRFALLWAVLTFLCNFIPYAGTIVAYCVPIGFAAVAGERDWTLVLAASLLLATHILSATIFEPMILGKAVGLSPLVILAALALWGSLWGFPGMLMAVPLSVVVLIVLEHFEASRPVARLLGRILTQTMARYMGRSPSIHPVPSSRMIVAIASIHRESAFRQGMARRLLRRRHARTPPAIRCRSHPAFPGNVGREPW